MKMVFEGNLIRLYRHRRRLPNGYTVDLEVIKHPGAVLIVPFLNKDKIVLIRQYRPVIDTYLWELPAGTLHRGEVLRKCAERELAEETGYQARQWKKIGYIYPAPGYTTEKIIIYAASILKKIKAEKEADEIISLKALSRNGIARLFKHGRITDAKTICALKLSGII